MYCSNPECPDFLATGAHGEFVAGVTNCPYCRQPLAATIDDGAAPLPGPPLGLDARVDGPQ